MQIDQSTFDGVKSVLVQTLGIEDRADSLTPDTPLFGSIPELDSLGHPSNRIRTEVGEQRNLAQIPQHALGVGHR